ncbi:MAG TPA: hypothetical protein VNU70_11045 [Puia sp.]|jgi:hypothetical protein|nr:hypothetical protein [Puia sp.]
MYVQQTFSLLFFPKRNKAQAGTGKVPIYARLMIDGITMDRVVKGLLIDPDHWNPETKTIKSEEPKSKTFNKKLAQLLTDVHRSIDLVQASQQVATP